MNLLLQRGSFPRMALRALSSASASASASSVAAPPKRIAVTGAAGNIGYALLMRIASGQIFGPHTPVEISLVEVPGKPFDVLRGVVMELKDGAFPLLRAIHTADNPAAGFADADVAILVGAAPRGKGMARADLLNANGQIFVAQGRALNDVAKRDVKVLVVGNPVNTNALIAAENAPDLSPDQFMAMTRLDQNRAMAQVAAKTRSSVVDVERLVIWGNHSESMYPDLSHALVAGKPALDVINDHAWVRSEFIPRVQKRGQEIIQAREKSSAASAASAAIDHLRDLFVGSGNAWQSIALRSDGSYGIDEGIWYSVPCICPGGGTAYTRVLDLPAPDEFSAAMMDATRKELLAERDAIRHLLPSFTSAKGTPVADAPKGGRKKRAASTK
jgi:malate dehydrogenase